MEKRQAGRYYTRGNPFGLEPFRDWAKSVNLTKKEVLEPFAGANNIIYALQNSGYSKRFSSFDILPSDESVKKRDTIKNFPTGYKVCITNPPWLAKNSAKRRGLWYPETIHDDLYKHCLDLCLENCEDVGALIPATFLNSKVFRARLDTVIFLHDRGMFNDTENPVCLALFKKHSDDVKIFFDNQKVGNLSDLERKLPNPKYDIGQVRFNDPKGQLGFIAFDQTNARTIQFCPGEQLSFYEIKDSSRMITRISGDFGNVSKLVKRLNNGIEEFRNETSDVFLTPFKGLRKDVGMYRRRMEYAMARDFIATHV